MIAVWADSTPWARAAAVAQSEVKVRSAGPASHDGPAVPLPAPPGAAVGSGRGGAMRRAVPSPTATRYRTSPSGVFEHHLLEHQVAAAGGVGSRRGHHLVEPLAGQEASHRRPFYQRRQASAPATGRRPC